MQWTAPTRQHLGAKMMVIQEPKLLLVTQSGHRRCEIASDFRFPRAQRTQRCASC